MWHFSSDEGIKANGVVGVVLNPCIFRETKFQDRKFPDRKLQEGKLWDQKIPGIPICHGI